MAEVSKITSKYQATITKSVRDRLLLRAGDTIVFNDQNGSVIIAKANKEGLAYLKSLEETLSEWSSPEDEEAFGDIQ